MTADLPRPPDLGLTWRAAVEADVPAIVVLQDACFATDATYREAESEVLDRFDDPYIDASSDSLLGIDASGAVLVSVWSIVPSAATTKWRAFEEWYIHPEIRTETVMEFALGWWEARSRQRLALLDDNLPKVLWFSAYAHRTELIAWLEGHGYVVERYYDELIRDLSIPIPEVELPPGVHLVPAESARPGDQLAVHNEAFRDHWGSQPFTQERWDHFKNEFYLPDASYITYAGETPVGHVMSGKWPHDFEDRGFAHAWILSLGVVRSHRKRGLASALVAKAMHDFVADGMEYAMLEVDSENPTGAYGLYENLGFVPARRTVALLKPV